MGFPAPVLAVFNGITCNRKGYLPGQLFNLSPADNPVRYSIIQASLSQPVSGGYSDHLLRFGAAVLFLGFLIFF
jgi:hypothetical protein